jgi:hypothetical protein
VRDSGRCQFGVTKQRELRDANRRALDLNGIYRRSAMEDNGYGGSSVFSATKGLVRGFYDRDGGFHVVRAAIINNPPVPGLAEMQVVCVNAAVGNRLSPEISTGQVTLAYRYRDQAPTRKL